MAMDFFAAQDCARRNTTKLFVLFGVAILLILAFTDLVLFYGLGLHTLLADSSGDMSADAGGWNLEFLFWINLAVLLLILGGTAYKISALSGGGDAVAHMLDGQPIFYDDPDPACRRLLNVVDEMALAAGVPAPQVYLLPEAGINAFAAGFEPSDTVVGVTAGALEHLNREQLQGVIAHEFSHILSGDMRLNVRMAGVLHGIMLLGLIGRGLSHSDNQESWEVRRPSIRSSLVGLGLMIAGYFGCLCGRLIKAAICRQREYLADAAAVQFTRNPGGIGGALLQIGASGKGGQLRHRNIEQMSHAFFCNTEEHLFFSRLLAAHPPLASRIKRLLPDWDGVFPQAASAEPEETAASGQGGGGVRSGAGPAAEAAALSASFLSAGQLAAARALKKSFPKLLHQASRNPYSAHAIIFFLLLDECHEIRAKQLACLKDAADQSVHAELERLVQSGVYAREEHKVALAELALPRLRGLSARQARIFLDNVQALIRADGKVSLFEWCLGKMVIQYLHTMLPEYRPPKSRLHELAAEGEAAAVVFSACAHLSADQEKKAATLFQAACAETGLSGQQLLPASALGLAVVDRAVDALASLAPKEQARLLAGCMRCLGDDFETAGKPRQWEMLRGLCAALGIPVPLIPQSVAAPPA